MTIERDRWFARVDSIAEITLGSELIGAHPSGSTIITLEDNGDWDDPEMGVEIYAQRLFEEGTAPPILETVDIIDVTTNTSGENDVTTLAVNKPTGVQNGDVIFAIGGGRYRSTGNVPSGFSLLERIETAPGSPGINEGDLFVGYKVISDADSEPASYNFTRSSTAGRLNGTLILLRDCDIDNLIVDSTQDDYGGEPPGSLSGITMDQEGLLLLAAHTYSSSDDVQIHSPPSGFTERSDLINGSSTSLTRETSSHTKVVGTGATGEIVIGLSESATQSLGILVGIRAKETPAVETPSGLPGWSEGEIVEVFEIDPDDNEEQLRIEPTSQDWNDGDRIIVYPRTSVLEAYVVFDGVAEDEAQPARLPEHFWDSVSPVDYAAEEGPSCVVEWDGEEYVIIEIRIGELQRDATHVDPATLAPLQSLTWDQGVASAEWVISHDLAFQPNVTVVDTAGRQCEGEVEYGDGVVTLRFSGAFSGKAYLS